MTQAPQNVNSGTQDRPFLQALRLYRTCGFNVIPLRPREKRPPEGFEWKPFQTRKVTEEELFAWDRKYPDANWAVVCGQVSGLVVLDADDEDAVNWIQQYMPATTFRVRSSRGCHFYYKVHPGQVEMAARLNFKNRGVNVDVQRDGKYVVAPGSVHPSGAVYELSPDANWEKGPQGIVDPFYRPTPSTPSTGTQLSVDLSGTRNTFSPVGEGERHNLLVSRVGTLLKEGVVGNDLLKAALDINKELCRPPLGYKEVESIVDSLSGVEQKKQPAPAPSSPQAAIPASKPEDFVADTSDPLTENPWTDEILHPGGILERIMDYTEESAIRTERAFALAGAIVVMGSILGQRIQAETGLLTNMYCMAVGGSASGKDAPKRAAVKLMRLAAPGLYAGSDVSSEVAILTHLKQDDCHRACLVLDEVGMLLQACKRPNSAKAGVVKLLTELYSGYGAPYVKIYALRECNVTVDWHSLSLLGLSVADELFASMQDGETVNGWLARNLVFEVRGAPRKKKRVVSTVPDDSLLRELRDLWKIKAMEKTQMTDVDGNISLDPGFSAPAIIRMDEAAASYHWQQDELADGLAAQCDSSGDKAGASLWARAGEHAWKLALIHAASRAGAAVVDDRIRLEDATWAWALVNTHHRRLVARVKSAIFKTEFEEILQGVRAAIQLYVRLERAKGRERPGAPKSFIVKRNRGVPPRLLDDALKTLCASDEVFYLEGWKSSDTSKRELNLYCIGHRKERDDEE